ncbi:Hypothetical predicted protein [Paramuricea clavata]|uniref:Uncharacterized protein n=1 Tax=Paramuricea clavata TaxID=317549 RepID=A0A6S7HFZ0_PARCT|nr:Hypothetical predicted protein [Paramuricea clavata]
MVNDTHGDCRQAKRRHTGVLARRKDVQELISKSKLPPNNEIVNEDNTIATEHPQESEIVNADCSNFKSTSCQTIALEYFGKNKTTQTKKSMLSTTATKGTQTLLTVNSLSKLLVFPETNSTGSQTDSSENIIEEHIVDSSKTNECGTSENVVKQYVDSSKTRESCKADANVEISGPPPEELCESDCNESCDGSYCTEFDHLASEESQSDQEASTEEISKQNKDRVLLSREKSIENQLKFIICEESIAHIFGICQKCGSSCSVSIGNRIGSYCMIYISCSSNQNHDISWSTGPLINRLPAMNLLITSTILSTGMESNKTLRFMESLNILCIKRREMSNLQSTYAIPAIFNMWRLEQQSLINGIKDKPVIIASDMRVDSPGHSGLLGSGSTLDVEQNVILDTQVIKVIGGFRYNV